MDENDQQAVLMILIWPTLKIHMEWEGYSKKQRYSYFTYNNIKWKTNSIMKSLRIH